MLKVLVWQVSKDTSFKDKAIKILEQQHNGIEIVGEAVNDDIAKVEWGGGYKVLLVVGARWKMSDVVNNAIQLNLPEEKMLGDWIVTIPGFKLEKYRKLQRSQLSIFAMNCFGGLISNMLALPFRSPTINMFFTYQEYLRLLRAPRVYMEENLVLKKTIFYEPGKYYYPVFTLGNVDIFMNHYPDFDEAKSKWNERKQKINWYNLFVTMYTDDEKFLREFNALPYGKKVCFVSFPSDLDSAWYINPEVDFDRRDPHFYEVVNNFARGKIFYYDIFDMLLYGKKTPLIDMG